MISLETVSPNPMGASNATTGLVAGATNSTLSQLEGSTSSVYTEPVWYQGGVPTTSDVNLWHEHDGMHRAMHEEHGSHDGAAPEPGSGQEGRGGWMYFTGSEHAADAVAASSAAKGSRKAGHVYTNDDVTRQNDKNGTVKHDGKTEKM